MSPGSRVRTRAFTQHCPILGTGSAMGQGVCGDPKVWIPPRASCLHGEVNPERHQSTHVHASNTFLTTAGKGCKDLS